MSSASRRKFLWLGGGVAASFLLFPNSSTAAKVASAVKRTAGATKRTTGKSAARKSSATRRSGTAGKGKAVGVKTATSGKAAVKKSQPVRRTVARRSAAPTRASSAARGARSATAARADVAFAPSRLESPASYSPGRAFSFGAGLAPVRNLSLYNIHTGERVAVDYYVDGRYDPEALRAFDNLLRDYHNDEVCQFDPRVLNQLFDLRNALGSRETFHVCSGYRSPITNESYRRAGARVAEHSYHMTGQAIDVYLPGRDIRQLRNVAVAMRAGGVGYYPSDGFVHLDSGPVRRW